MQFYGATPREYLPTPRVQQASGEDVVDRIIDSLRHSATASEALLGGVDMAALGAERVQVCKARRWDAEETLRSLEKVVDRPAADWSDDSERTVKLLKVQSYLTGLRKAVAMLEAYERVAQRACRTSVPGLQSSPRDGRPRTPRSANRGSGSPRGASTRGSPRQGVSKVASPDSPPTCLKISTESTALLSRVAVARGEEEPEANQSWFFSIFCCTSRGDAWDHEASVENCAAAIDRLVFNAKRGDILCCAPADMMVDAVRYAHSPGADAPGDTVQRGDRILIQGRRGGWVFNKNGWLPLWHPISGGPEESHVLFAYDHRSSTFESDDDSDESEASQGELPAPERQQSPGDCGAGYSIQWKQHSPRGL